MLERRSGPAPPIAASPREWNGATGCAPRRLAEPRAPFSQCWRASENCRRPQTPTWAARRAVGRRSSFQIPQGLSGERSREHHRRLRLPQEFAEQHVEMVNAVFALDRVASAVIGRGAQATLNIFAEANIFLLHFVAEGNGAFDALLMFRRTQIVEKPLEDGERFVVRERNDDVRGDVIRIDVEHQVRKNPKIKCVLEPRAGRVHPLARVFRFHGTERRELLRVVAESVRAIMRVVYFFHQAGMGDGDVIALEIVVYVNLPVAIDDVVAALGKLQTFELETSRLLGNLTEIHRSEE